MRSKMVNRLSREDKYIDSIIIASALLGIVLTHLFLM